MSISEREILARRVLDNEYVHTLLLKMSMPSMVELAGHAGFDFVLIDTEHGTTAGDLLDNHIRAADSAGIATIVRVGSHDRAEVARALDAGAAGVALPQIETAEQARRAVEYALYPPKGLRGLATSTRAGGQGTVPLAEHLRLAENTLVIAQIETPLAVQNLEQILSVDGISAVWFGFNDLGILLSAKHDSPDDVQIALDDARGRLADACRAAGKPFFVITDGDGGARRWVEAGATGLMTTMLGAAAASFREAIRVAHEAESRAMTR